MLKETNNPPQVSVIIPNWNGEAFLARCLSAAQQSVAESGYACELLLLDDASTDKSLAVASGFSSVRTIQHPANVGFGENVNRGVAAAAGEIIILLNNDLICQSSMIRELVEPMEQDKKLFGVSGKTIGWSSGEPNHLNMRGRWTAKGYQLTWSDESEPASTMFLQGGSCAMRRQEFLDWGGFDSLYAPGYWEDYDMSYQALKAGWNLLYNPRATGMHLGQGSMIRAHGSQRIEDTRWRNFWRFIMLNIHDRDLLWQAMKHLPGQTAFDRSRRLLDRLERTAGLTHNMSDLLKKRGDRAHRSTISDAEIAERFNAFGTLSEP